ncbi:MAG: serine hydroxymethyltransferase [Euryarchaeota archaeon]|nr:serine hydroxymethyltransferase [Euryarchaeota archaeon]
MTIDDIMRSARAHNEWFKNSLPMIASENITSPTVRQLLASDLAHRYAEGTVGHRLYQGVKYIDEIEQQAIDLACKLFKAEHVNVQPISGVNANIAAFFALAKPRERLMALDTSHGGHISHGTKSVAGLCDLKIVKHPFDYEEMNIDADAMVSTIYEKEPKIILFGASLFLFPHPIAAARDAAREVGAYVVYDSAHVLGLIAGGQFQDPLREGVDVMTGSTHKTFPGPQGGIIFTTHALAEAVDAAVFPGTVSNHHLHHVAGLAVTLIEMLQFGRAYARQIIKNAQTLGAALYNEGCNVLCPDKGFTESHQIVIDVGRASSMAVALEEANIIANKNLLPWDDHSAPENPSGLRFGTQELTRLGMKETEMKVVAKLIQRVLDGEIPEKVKKDVVDFKNDYQEVEYCFSHELGAYQFPEW